MIGHAVWAARMGVAVGAIYVDAVRESWRRQLAEADLAADALILYALRDSWARTHVSHPPIAGSI